MPTTVSAMKRKSIVSARRSEVSPATTASTSTSTSKRRLVRRSAALAPCRPSNPILFRISVAMGRSESKAKGRKGRSTGGDVVRGRRFLLHLALDDLALHRADHVDQQPADQVIALVLQGPGEQFHALDLEHLAVDVLGAHAGSHAALD